MPQVRKTEEQTALENRIKKTKTLLKNQTLQLNTLKSRQKADRERKRRSDKIAKAQGEIDRAMYSLSGIDTPPPVSAQEDESFVATATTYKARVKASAPCNASGSASSSKVQSDSVNSNGLQMLQKKNNSEEHENKCGKGNSLKSLGQAESQEGAFGKDEKKDGLDAEGSEYDDDSQHDEASEENGEDGEPHIDEESGVSDERDIEKLKA